MQWWQETWTWWDIGYQEGIGSGGMELNFNILLPKSTWRSNGSVSEPPLLWCCEFISAVLLYVPRESKSFDDFPDRPDGVGFLLFPQPNKKQVQRRVIGSGGLWWRDAAGLPVKEEAEPKEMPTLFESEDTAMKARKSPRQISESLPIETVSPKSQWAGKYIFRWGFPKARGKNVGN